jgi:hypothetical protein
MQVLMPFWLRAPQGSFYQEFVRGISCALHELGHEAIYLPFNDCGKYSQDDALILTRMMERNQPDAVLDIACWGYALTHSTTPSAFLANAIPYAAWLFDHPFNQALNAIVANRLVAVYPDLGHPQQIKFVFPSLALAGGIFAAPAVHPPAGGCATRTTDRNIDVLYVGNLDLAPTARFWRDPQLLGHTPQGLDAAFCDALADSIIAQPERSLHASLEEVLKGRTWKESLDLNLHMRAVEHHSRHLFRREAVRRLAYAGVPMRIVGKGWELLDLPPNACVQQAVPYGEMLRLASAAQICLDASTYVDGANDRVFSYAVNGAVCFTNASAYLRRALGKDGGVLFYSLRDLGGLVEDVRFWLARPQALAEIGARARASVLNAHTWRHRIEHLLGELTGWHGTVAGAIEDSSTAPGSA